MKVALVYDWVNHPKGGAERILLALNKIYPKAPLFTSVYDPSKAKWTSQFPEIKSSFLQRFPKINSYFRKLAPLLVVGFEQFNFDKFDLVISVTSGPGKAILTKPGTFHLCYCLTPPRYLWEKQFFKNTPAFGLRKALQKQDYYIAQRPDLYLTTSKNTASKIKKFYRRNVQIVYPGVDLAKFKPAKGKDNRVSYFLIVSRLVPYKKVDLVIKVFNKLGWPLKIIGEGREEKYLKSIAQKNIEFLGTVSDKVLLKNYQRCQAVIFPQEEDFGLVPLEAQACGRPVIAFNQGGARETIIPNKTGLLFDEQTIKNLTSALKKFKTEKYNPADCRKQAENFSLKKFMLSFEGTVKKILKKHKL